MSKYLNQLYNKHQVLQKKLNTVKSKSETSKDLNNIGSTSHKTVSENNNIKPDLGKDFIRTFEILSNLFLLEDGVVNDANITDGSVPGSWCTLPCRSIRIGNYKVLPKEKITITEKGVQIKVPAILNPNEVVTINIVMKDILKVLAHFGKQMPLLFLYISPTACQKTRKLLKMTNSQSFYLEVTSPDETQKRITILPDKLNEDSKVILKQHFSGQLQELESKDANEILVRSSPKDMAKMKEKMSGAMTVQSQEKSSAPPGQVVTYCQYPPEMAGNISVTNEDFNCLEAEQFLNDVIIDFYLKYLQYGKFTNIKDVMDKSHIFTTYFYKRLTMRPKKVKVSFNYLIL